MANTVVRQDRSINTWNDRPVVILMEDGEYYHGAVIGPAGMSYASALEIIDGCWSAAVDANIDEWNYDDVIQNLRDAGFEIIDAAVWDEAYAYREIK